MKHQTLPSCIHMEEIYTCIPVHVVLLNIFADKLHRFEPGHSISTPSEDSGQSMQPAQLDQVA